MAKGKKKKWMKFRHRVVRNLASLVLRPVSKLKYGIRVERFKEQGKRQFLILFNHQTAFDQFFVGLAFRGPVYYVATEDLFSNGWVSSLIRYIVAPIPIKKQSTDITAVMNCMRVAREGGTIAIAPEGNRTFSGKTEHMNPAIATMARKMKLPIAFFRIEGGYGVQPRWSDGVRKGKMRAYVSRVLEPDDVAKMNNDELFSVIQSELFVDEGSDTGLFKSKRRAEYLERAMYVCPFCGLSTFESHGNEIECLKCHRKVTYGENKELKGVGFDFPFRFVSAWYDAQCDFINAFDTREHTQEPLYRDEARFSEVIVYKKKVLIDKNASIALYGDRIVINEGLETEKLLAFDEVSVVSVLGRNKVNIYHQDKIYQLKGSPRFNALRFVNLFYRHKNIVKGEENGKFLGL